MADNNNPQKRQNLLFGGTNGGLESPIVTEEKKHIYTQLWNETTEKEYLARVKKQATLAATQIINQAMQEANTIRTQAEKVGYIAGEKSGKAFIENKSIEYLQYFETILKSMEEYSNKLYANLEAEMLEIITLCVEKITNIVLSHERKEIVTKTIQSFGSHLHSETNCTLLVNEEDYPLFQEILASLDASGNTRTWELVVDNSIPEASCRFENKYHTIESNIERRKSKILSILAQLQFTKE